MFEKKINYKEQTILNIHVEQEDHGRNLRQEANL